MEEKSITRAGNYHARGLLAFESLRKVSEKEGNSQEKKEVNMSIEQIQTRAEEQGVAPMSSRLDFAKDCFDNAQELNRATDGKANMLLSSVGLLTGALSIIASNVLNSKPDFTLPGILRLVAFALLVVYLLVAFSVIYSATKVYRPSANTLRPDTAAPGMIFPLMLLARYQADGKADEHLYLQKLSTATEAEILHDYVNQIVENSNIYRSKQKLINDSMERFRLMCIIWIVTILWIVIVALFAG